LAKVAKDIVSKIVTLNYWENLIIFAN